MSAMLRSSSTSIILLLAISLSSNRAEPAEMKAAVSGTSTANLRAGAGVDHPPKLTLKEGDQVTVEKAEGEWFLVIAADGQKGYIHKNLLRTTGQTLGESVTRQISSQQVAAVQPKEAAKDVTAPAPAGASPPFKTAKEGGSPPPTETAAARQDAPEAKSQSILQIIEGHEAEFKIAALVAGIAFVLGWICGSSYSLRRERSARRKLRF